jgi:hypothetical protein
MDAGTWEQFATEAPELAERVRVKFAAAKHHVLATLAADGSPRVHGVEVQLHRADLTVGMMFDSIKAKQLQRDGRFALHANPGDDMGVGDAKVIGTAVEVSDPDALQRYVDEVHPPPPFHMFRLLIGEVVLTFLHPDGDRLVINVWRPGRAVTVIERA